ncbi:MAG: hypothetical protein AAFP20_11665, partial [Cyanobacteria bacterium J06614_10]
MTQDELLASIDKAAKDITNSPTKNLHPPAQSKSPLGRSGRSAAEVEVGQQPATPSTPDPSER